MKRRYYRILSFVLSACILLSTLSVSAFALSWDGSSTGGGGGGENATVNGFAIRKTEDNCIGYRFSVVDNNGNTKNGKVIDVFTKKGYGYYEMEHGYKFDTKYNKKQLIAYQDGNFSTSLTQVNCYKEEEMDFVSTLPDPEDVETWQNYSGNLNPVLAKLSAGTVDTLSYGDKVLIEPIYDVKLEKVYHAITVTELAIYGKHLLGADSDGGTPNHDAGTWGFISSYTNRHYPNSLYTPDGQGLWTGAEPIANRTRATFYTMINVGYGVGIAFTQTKNTNYTIRFNANGGTGSMADMTMAYGTAKNLTANSYTKTGHYFSGWNTKANGSGTSYTNCQSVSNLTTVNGGVVTLYAQWTPYYLDVYYHANGGSVSSSTYYLRSNWVAVTSTQAFKNDRWVYNLTYSGGLYDASAFGLYKTGYVFTKWGSETGGGTLYAQDDSTLRATDLNPAVANGNTYKYLYAQWQPITYTIVFNKNGGTGTMSDLSMTYDRSKNLTANAFTRSGYNFAGWNTKADGTGTGYADKQSVKNLTATQGDVITLYAQWTTNSYTIAFDGNGATNGTTSAMTMTFGQSKNLNANGYTRAGYIFQGWAANADGSGAQYTDKQSVKDLTTVNGATVTLYAQWMPVVYTIKFDGNGNTSGSTSSMFMNYDEVKNLTANGFTKTGYHFVCWNTDSDGIGTAYSDKQSVKNLTTVNCGTVTLYAQWEPNVYYVVFDGNGATGGTMEKQTFIYDEEQTLNANAYTKSHYTFSCWSAFANGIVPTFTDKQTVKNLTSVNGATVTLYAQWQYKPSLIVNKCEVYSGTAVGDGSYLGYTTGSTFSLYRYLNGYPMLGDELWYTVSFYAETVNTYVRQTVWIQNGETVSRDVYSNSNTTFSVKLDPYTVTSEDQYFYVRARMDWIDANGNVLKFGTAKVFYIPVRPTVHRPEVTLKDYTGSIAAVGKETSSTGKVYLGQLVSANYKYTTDNEWVSKNMLTGTMQEWKNGGWTAVDGSPDYEAMQSMIYPTEYISGSTLGKVRVMDNSGSGKSIMRFELTSAWSSDQSRTLENTVISIPVVKADVELKEIRLVNASGYYADASHLMPGEVLTVQYLYKNNTDVAIYVEGYDSNRNKIDGVYRIEPNGSIIVEGATVTAPTSGKFTVWGGVYLEGAGLGNTVWESNGTNNEKEIECFAQYPLKLVPIEPNAPYRESTEVITSYWLVNNGSIGCKPSDNISVRFKVYKPNGTLITTVTKTQVVCPGNDKNLVYFKWAVPTGLNGNDVTVTAEIIGSGTSFFSVSSRYGTRKYDLYQTPDTQYEETMPSGFTVPSAPSSKSDRATWYEYSYNGTSFVKTNYGIASIGNSCTIEPATGSTAEYSGGKWIMKSGYGISVKLSTAMTLWISEYASAKTDSYTQPQYFTALYPEYKYFLSSDKCTTLTVSGSYAELPVFKTYGKVHFTPLWYPDGNYTVSVIASDCWTPAGMISATSVSNTITISGSAYDDWYVGH